MKQYNLINKLTGAVVSTYAPRDAVRVRKAMCAGVLFPGHKIIPGPAAVPVEAAGGEKG